MHGNKQTGEGTTAGGQVAADGGGAQGPCSEQMLTDGLSS
jgi:hypothetical protein